MATLLERSLRRKSKERTSRLDRKVRLHGVESPDTPTSDKGGLVFDAATHRHETEDLTHRIVRRWTSRMPLPARSHGS